MHAPVRGVAMSCEKAAFLHSVEVMGERRPLDTDFFGEFALVGDLSALDRHKDEPHRQTAVSRRYSLFERTRDVFRGCPEKAANRRANRFRHGDIVSRTARYDSV